MVEDQPATIRLDGGRAGADLGGLPALGGTHHMTVLAPVGHIRRLGNVDIPEGGVTAVGGAGEHHVVAADPPGEQHAVPVEGQVCILQLVEGLEVKGVAHTNGRMPAVCVAPGDVVAILDEAYPGVIAVLELCHFGNVGFKLDPLRLNIPVHTVLGEASMQLHVPLLIVHTEHPGEASLKGNHCTVEHTVGGGENVPLDDGVCLVTPDYVLAVCRPVLPGQIGDRFFVQNFYVHRTTAFLFA